MLILLYYTVMKIVFDVKCYNTHLNEVWHFHSLLSALLDNIVTHCMRAADQKVEKNSDSSRNQIIYICKISSVCYIKWGKSE